MKKPTNCPNCGAPLEIGEVKCPYCGTTYYDLSAIDFDSNEPIFLTIRKNNMLITQKVMPQTFSFEASCDEVFATDNKGNKLMALKTSMTLDTNITFTAIPDKNNRLAVIKNAE